MIKRIVVAGSRNFNNWNLAKEFIDFCIRRIKNEHTLVFMSGCCKGADKLGERYATENGYKIEYYPVNWDKYGKSAGPKRNEIMAEKCDFVICFLDGKSNGTKSMINYSKKYNKPLRIKYYDCP